jgi:hypothetical protein
MPFLIVKSVPYFVEGLGKLTSVAPVSPILRDVGNVMYERTRRAYVSCGGPLKREGALKVLWQCDPMTLHWRPLRGAGSTLDCLSWTLPLK